MLLLISEFIFAFRCIFVHRGKILQKKGMQNDGIIDTGLEEAIIVFTHIGGKIGLTFSGGVSTWTRFGLMDTSLNSDPEFSPDAQSLCGQPYLE